MPKATLHSKKSKGEAREAETVVLTKDEVGEIPAAVASSTAITPFTSLPAIFDGEAIDVAPPPPSGAYVSFVTAKSTNYPALLQAIPGVKESDPVLCRPNVPPVKLAPFKAYLVGGWGFFGVFDNSGNLTAASRERQRGKEWCEVVETMLLLHLPGNEVVAARCSFRRAQCAAAHTLVAGYKQSMTPEWGSLSKAHEWSLQLPKPFLRGFGTITTGQKVAKASGLKYNLATAVVSPSTPTEVNALGNYFTKDRAAFDDVWDSFQRRIEEVSKHLDAGE